MGVKLDINISYIPLRMEEKASLIDKTSGITTEYITQIDFSAEDVFLHSSRIIIKGDAGSGKTTLLQWLALHCADGSFAGKSRRLNKYVPFFIRLRDYYKKDLPTGKELVRCISPALVDLVPDEWLGRALYGSQCLFLIDGLDEVSSSQRGAVDLWLRDFLSISPKSIYVITSRPSAVEANFLADCDFDEFFLKPMSPREILTFVDYWHDALSQARNEEKYLKNIATKRTELLMLLDENRSLKRLSSTPLLCAVICTLNFNEKLKVISGRIDLYSTAARLLYHDRNLLRKIDDPKYERLTRAEKERLLSELAYWFVRNGLTNCTTEQMVDRVQKIIGESGNKMNRQETRNLVRSIVLRSGVLKEISPEIIQFLHKTFQEYLAAISVVWHEDEMSVVRNLDLRNWSELYLMVVAKTTERLANNMLLELISRARKLGDEGSYLVLLAASSLRETLGISKEVGDAISMELGRLVPPTSNSVSYQLSGAGDLVLPFLKFRESYTPREVSYIISILGQIDNKESRKLLIQYLSDCELGREVIENALEALTYLNDEKITREVFRALKNRNSPLFFRKRPVPNLLVFSDRLAEFQEWLPKCRSLTLDCVNGVDPDDFLNLGVFSKIRLEELTIANSSHVFRGEVLRRFNNIQVINFLNVNKILDVNFLSSLDRVNLMRIISSDVNDFEGIEYADKLLNVYISDVDVGVVMDALPYFAGSKCNLFVSKTCYHQYSDFHGIASIWDDKDIGDVVQRLIEKR